MLLILGLMTFLTYIYSGKDRRVALLFAVFCLLVLLLATGYENWSNYLQTHFVGRFDDEGIPYRVSREGWLGLWDAWPLWSLPTLLLSGILALGVWGFCLFTSPRRPQNMVSAIPKEVKKAEPAPAPTASNVPSNQSVTQQLEFESLKRSLAVANDKLAQAIQAKSLAELTLKELRTQSQQLTHTNTSESAVLSDQIKALELERDAHLAENQELTQQLMLQTEELSKLKALVGKLVKK
jgi:hypothetical protein